MSCVFYMEKVKKGKYVVWIKKVLITSPRDKVLYDGEIKVNSKLERLLKENITEEQKIKYKSWLKGLKID